MSDDIDSNGTKADDKPKHMPANPMGNSNSYALAHALNKIRAVQLAAVTVHETITPIKTIKIDTVDELEKHLADGTIEVKSMKFEGEGLVDTPTKVIVLDNANETQKDFMNDLKSMQRASMYAGGRPRSLASSIFLPMLFGVAASSGQGNHSASSPVSNVVGRQRLMITSDERQRRKKLKKIAARDRKRNRK